MGALEKGWQMAETNMNRGPCGEKGGSGPWQPPCSTAPASALGLGGPRDNLQGWSSVSS